MREGNYSRWECHAPETEAEKIFSPTGAVSSSPEARRHSPKQPVSAPLTAYIRPGKEGKTYAATFQAASLILRGHPSVARGRKFSRTLVLLSPEAESLVPNLGRQSSGPTSAALTQRTGWPANLRANC